VPLYVNWSGTVALINRVVKLFSLGQSFRFGATRGRFLSYYSAIEQNFGTSGMIDA
jgi:hypothetical protein